MLYSPRVSVLILLAWLAGCGSPKSHAQSQEAANGPNTGFGRPAVLARHEGEARMLQGRKPIWIKVDPQTLGSRTLTVGMEDMPPGDSIGVHKHLQEDEVVFVHRGEVEVTLDDSILRATAGGTVFIPRGTWIGFRVKGTDTATIVFAFNTRVSRSACGFCRPRRARPLSRLRLRSWLLPDGSATKCAGLTRLISRAAQLIKGDPLPGGLVFEHRSEQVLPGHRFALRLLRYLLLSAGIVLVSLVGGIAGYEHFEHLDLRDAFLNAAMLLGGMGPVDTNLSPAGKVFAGAYALYAGLVFVVAAGVLLAPVVHRILHSVHCDLD